MKIRYLRHPIESIRTAPFGMSLIASGIGGGAIETSLVGVSSPIDVGVTVGSWIVELCFGFGGAALASDQFALRNRLENSMEQVGYSERVFAKTTDEWCNRQTARVVLEPTGHLDEYIQLCKARESSAQLTALPHI